MMGAACVAETARGHAVGVADGAYGVDPRGVDVCCACSAIAVTWHIGMAMNVIAFRANQT